jgi:exopolysaccharide biosynthesis polyprenyl glycosylphosphotransferase
MLKEHQYVFTRINMAIDLCLTAVSVILAHLLRNQVLAPYVFPQVFREPACFSDYSWLAWVLPVIMVVFLAHNRYYASQRLRSFGETSRAILLSAIETTVAAMVIGFFLQQRFGTRFLSDSIGGDNVSRGVILLVPVVLTLLMILKTYLVRKVLIRLRSTGHNWRTLLLVGSGDTLRGFIRLVRGHPFWGFRLEGIIDDSGREAIMVDEVPVVGTLQSLLPYVDEHPVDEIVFVPARRSLEELAPYFEQCEEMGIRTRLSLNFFRHTIARPVLDSFEDVPVVTYSPTLEINTALLFKYAFDRIAAFLLLIALSPVFVAAIILSKLTSDSWSDPVFYGQTRCGLNGKLFTCWKFRSMRVNADSELERLRDKNEMEGPVFKIKEDPRITRLGRILRKTSIDEFPQIWNVLRGDMSLVGPRPPIPAEVAKYDRWQRRRLSMKPGITCLWQVNGRNRLPFDTWMKLDLEYIDNWSLVLDFRILCKTVYVVATGYGAM